MTTWDEDKALATLFANTRRKKRTEDLATVARACEYLVGLYGSQQRVADKIGLSSEMIREFRKVLALQRPVLDMVERREIDRLDVAYQLSKIKDPGRQLRAAKDVAALESNDVRTVQMVLARTGSSPREAVHEVLAAKLKGLHVFVLDFDEQQYKAIEERAKEAGLPAPGLVKKAILDWLRRPSRSPKRGES